MKNFKDFGLPDSLLEQINNIGFKEPTPIQDRSIPHALDGKDILGSAGTGTGKTGAFGIPLLVHLLESESNYSLILLPTRELALQVMKALHDFMGKKNQLNTALIIGGEDMGKQLRQLRNNPRIIVGTPGRINDHLRRKSLKLNNVNFLVLDEVDRMLDMGFGVQLDAIAEYLPKERQTLMFSATMPNNIQKLSAKYLNDPIHISIDTSNKSPVNIKQEDLKISSEEKFPRLVDELSNRTGSIIVFMKTKYSADAVAKKLRKEGHEAESLHGDLRQNKRNSVISRFRKQDYRILVATDIASRGLDIPHIEHVINYDLPQCPEDYIHRIGRTARAGASGQALNFLSPADSSKWNAIQRMLNPGIKLSDSKKSKSFKKDKRSGAGARKAKSKSFGGNSRFERDEFSSTRSDDARPGSRTKDGDKKRFGGEGFSSARSDDARPGSRTKDGGKKRFGGEGFSSARSDDARPGSRTKDGGKKRFGGEGFSSAKSDGAKPGNRSRNTNRKPSEAWKSGNKPTGGNQSRNNRKTAS